MTAFRLLRIFAKITWSGSLVSSVPIIPAIGRLLEIGALTTTYMKMTPELLRSMGDKAFDELVRYTVTPLGQAIIACVTELSDMFSPETLKVLEAMQEAEKQKVTQAK